MKKNIMKIRLEAKPNPDYEGTGDRRGYVNVKTKFIRCRNFKEASAICAQFCDDNNLGGGNWTGGQIFENGKQVAHVSYNGRIWWGQEDVMEGSKEVRFYKAFPFLAIPQCLDNKDWSDESWNNDVTARSQKPLDDVHTIEVWVFEFLQEDREDSRHSPHRYSVCWYNDNGDMIGEAIYCETEAEIVAAVAEKEASYNRIMNDILRKEGRS
jgi:hypothetical protein